jgi:hypothetical protein
LLLAELAFGDSAAAILVGVVAVTLGAYALTRELTRDHTLALLTTALVVASPFFAVQSGVYLGYLFSMGLGLLFGASLLAGLRRDDWRLVALAGALLGYLFLPRPFDAVLWGGALGAYAVVASWGAWRRLARAAVIGALAFAPFIVVTLAYNRAVTGSATQFPFTAKEPLDTFGFGARRLMPDTPVTNFTWRESVRGELRNAFYLPQFLVGAWLGVAVAVVGLWLRRRERSTLALLAIMAAFPAGYAVFWGIRLSSFYAFLSAPLYFLPLFVPLCILIATVILALWRHRRALGVGLAVLLLVVTAPFLVSRLRSNHAVSRAQEPWRDAVETIRDDSLLFVASSGPFVMHLNPFSRNTPALDGRLLYATDLPLEMLDLMAAYPTRTPYLELTSDPALGDAFRHPYPDVPDVTLIPLSVLGGRNFTFTVRYTATSTDPVVASLKVGDAIETRTLATQAVPGEVYETEWRVGDAGTAVGAAPAVALPAGRGRITARVAQASSLDTPFAGRHLLQRFSYRTLDDRAELLNPPRRIVVRHVDGERETDEVVEMPEFDVDVVGSA